MSKFKGKPDCQYSFVSEVTNRSRQSTNGKTSKTHIQKSVTHFESFLQQEQCEESQEMPKTMKAEVKSLDLNIFEPWNLRSQIKDSQNRRNLEDNNQISQIRSKKLEFNSDDEEVYFCSIKKPDQFDFLTNKFEKIKLQSSLVDERPTLIRTRTKEKGLRLLSHHAFNVVKQLGQTTYKQVAYRLLSQTRQHFNERSQINEEQSKIIGEEEDRQESNVKRRVYDALNVLIALQVLQKKGKKICYQQNNEHQIQQNRTMKERILEKQSLVEKKRQILRQWQLKEIAINNLISANKNRQQQCASICLPFVCLVVPDDSDKTIKLSVDKLKFEINPVGEFSFYGDVDFVSKISCSMEH